MRTESTFLRIACKNEVGIILRFVGIPLRIGGTRSPEYSKEQLKETTAYQAMARIGILYKIEEMIRDKSPEERYEERQKHVRGKVILQPHGKEFFTWYSKHLFTLHGKHFFT